MPAILPLPSDDERPVSYADRLGGCYAHTVPPAQRRDRGLYLTPPEVADFMAGLLAEQALPAARSRCRLLDPAAGAGILLCAAVERLALLPAAARPRRIDIAACEIDPALRAPLEAVLAHLRAWARRRGVAVTARVDTADFVLRYAGALRDADAGSGNAFDAVIANPPYFKIPAADARAVAAAAVVHGQPNIYGLFMALGAALLREGGCLVCITPRSFASGPYFHALRRRLFAELRPVHVHLFGSRREAFRRDAVLQENVILCGVRQRGYSAAAAPPVTLSASRGAADLDAASRRAAPLAEVLCPDEQHLLRLAATEDDAALVRRVRAWPASLGRHGLAISTGPVVPFRLRPLLAAAGSVPGTHAPLLWMHHVAPMRVTWPLGGRKPEYLRAVPGAPLLPPGNYVLVRRFSATEQPRRLVAAPLLGEEFAPGPVALENHLNYVHRPGGRLSAEEARGLAALFNGALLDAYFRTGSGNTQVSAAELRALPLPSLEEIVALGRVSGS